MQSTSTHLSVTTSPGGSGSLIWPHLKPPPRKTPGAGLRAGASTGDLGGGRAVAARGVGAQTHEPGAAAEVDFADLWIVLAGVKTTV